MSTLLALPRPATDDELRARHPLGDAVPVDFAGREQCRFCSAWGTPCLCDSDYLWSLPNPWAALPLRFTRRQYEVRSRLARVELDALRGDYAWGALIDYFERHGFMVVDAETRLDALEEAGIR